MPYWNHSAPDADDGFWASHTDTDDGLHWCARGSRCADSTTVQKPDGSLAQVPARCYRTFCDSCRTYILACLRQLPYYYRELGEKIGDKGSGQGERVSGSRDRSILINVNVDALSTDMVNIIAAWAGRVSLVADLHDIDTDRPLRAYADGPFEAMCDLLAIHVDALLALTAEAMARFLTLEEAEDLPDGTPVYRNYYGEYAWAVLDLAGDTAGRDVIQLANRCRRMLDYTSADQEIAVPVTCAKCDLKGQVFRPNDTLADYAECRECGTQYVGKAFQALITEEYERELARTAGTSSPKTTTVR